MGIEKVLGVAGALLLAGNIASKVGLKNVEDDSVLPTASITSRVLGVELQQDCYRDFGSVNYNDGTCDVINELSGTWCCESTPRATNKVSETREKLAVYLGGSESYLGFGFLVAAGAVYLGKKKKE